jgi:SAM-dependent methyltransferase
MSGYQGGFAEHYDTFYADKPYDKEVALLDGLLREHADGPSDRLLDVACGTGRHAALLAARGWSVVGVDQSAAMLDRARARPGADGITFIQQDMQNLDVPGGPFDGATCLFDSIGYGVTNEAVVATLSGIRRHLRHGGLLAVEFWHAAAMLRSHDPVRVKRWETGTGTILRVSLTDLDIPAQLARVEYQVFVLEASGAYHHHVEVHENRFFLVQEMALLFRLGGFEPIRWLAGYDRSAIIDGTTWHVLALARAGVPGG